MLDNCGVFGFVVGFPPVRRFKAWFAWHFGSTAQERITMAWQRIEALERSTAQLSSALLAQKNVITALTSEFTNLRNHPANPTISPPNTRRARNWVEFRAAAENPRPIEVRQ